MKKTRQTIIILLLVLLSPCILFAHGWSRHADDLCYAMFGFSQDSYIKDGNTAEMENCLGKKDKYYKAFIIMQEAIAVAIDYTSIKTPSKAYNDLREKQDNLKHGIAPKSEFDISTAKYNLSRKGPSGNHRNVCHQGFDFSYVKFYKANNKTIDKTELEKMEKADTRWALGRQLLIDAASYAFFDNKSHMDPNDSIATFIAMNAYYIHLLGDLETADFKDLYPINSYKKLLKEYISKIKIYGKQLPPNCKYYTDKLISNLNRYLYFEKIPIEGRDYGSLAILEKLHEYLPEIIKRATYISNHSKAS